MAWWGNITGTVTGYLRLGLSGVRLKNNAGALSVRNAGDTADAPISASAATIAGDITAPQIRYLLDQPVRRWTARTSAADNDWYGIAWSPELGLFAAVAYTGVGNRVMTSPDGITWTARTSAADNDWLGIAWSPELGLFAAVAFSGVGNRVMTSPDGITWTARTSAADNAWFGIAWSPELGLFAAVASSGVGNRAMTSA